MLESVQRMMDDLINDQTVTNERKLELLEPARSTLVESGNTTLGVQQQIAALDNLIESIKEKINV